MKHMAADQGKVDAERQLLLDAQAKGGGAKLGAFVKLSGPGWLQSAITLGGGSLAGSLFLGILGGTSMLWLQLVAIAMGVVMLSAISYVTLSTGERPFDAINKHINPALGWSWLIATGMANIIWCMPQFSLCYEALDRCLLPGGLPAQAVNADTGEVGPPTTKLGVSFAILAATTCIVILNKQRGKAAKFFDLFLKTLVGMVVICFFGVTIYLSMQGALNWGAVFRGFVPDPGQWNNPAGSLSELMSGLSESTRTFWATRVLDQQRDVMIAAAATAVGINMTFLMPYSMLHRGWDKPFRGLARFDLSTGMAIPYILVTSCVVIAASYAFHAKVDEQFLSSDPAVFEQSPTFKGAKDMLLVRVDEESAGKSFDEVSAEMPAVERAALLAKMAELPAEEKKIASSLVKRDAFTLSKALAPLVGEKTANYIFGLGVFGMGFSTIIILMLINGFVFCEATGQSDRGPMYVAGCLVAGVAGALWPLIWDGPAKLWLAILTSSFGMMLLPIAYITFFLMMNSKSLMGDEKPTGAKMLAWNGLMGISVVGAIIAAGAAIFKNAGHPTAGRVVIALGVVFVVAVIGGFLLRGKAAVEAA
ncbi:MAG: divalent metal cation transporter [Planctomycetales bacterium]|nr:divalent metal cation transporter [Planctomycetales bacterium]